MRKSQIALALVIGGLVLTGCKKEPEKKIEPATTPTVPAAAPSTDTTPATTGPAITVTPPVTPPTTSPSVPSTPPDSTTPPVANTADADAKKLLTQTSIDIAGKKWDAATADLKKLNDMRPELSQNMKDAVTQAEEKFAAAKASDAIKLPGLGGTTPPSGDQPNK